ncbi:MAG: iron-containing redox enzyme family protein [Chitinophagales bacterium]|nr:iron-containing redox enzyme family protein [Chitinophagales bacterium]
MNNKLQELEQYVDQLWKETFQSEAAKMLEMDAAFKDKRSVAIYLSQVYHYAVHTPRHQALVGVNMNNNNFQYMHYCFEHAMEETGHELMALKDINALGFNVTADTMPPPLPSTQLLISFLYNEARSENPIHHLGYGFWSENACPFINDFMTNLMESMGLEKDQMTFYSGHVTLDESHAKEVREIIKKVVKTEEDWNGLKRVIKITFDLTIGIVKDMLDAYKELVDNNSEDFSIYTEYSRMNEEQTV